MRLATICILAALAAMLLTGTYATAQMHRGGAQVAEGTDAEVDQDRAEWMARRHKRMAEHKQLVEDAMKSLDEAEQAVKDGNHDAALAALAKAKASLTQARETMAGCPMCEKMGRMCPMCKVKSEVEKGQTKAVVNSTCPMMGTRLDKEKVPASLTREFQGQTVGFCCPNCPTTWDELTDAEKAEKLQGAM